MLDLTRIAELEQRETENAELKAKTNSQYNCCSIYLYSSVQAKSPEDKKVDDFLDLTYNDKSENRTRYNSRRNPLTSSNSISKTQGTNIKVNDDESGQELAQLFSDAKITEGKTIEAKHMLVYL
ncbi:hypothetical protein Glove_103g212 [Diversispora epigaea]|uniref:Uncharacterized protein n=1 Tax=Diversispora epigaea TaxID=1348612 RepID=A0A397J3S1_9GLOM|nr:hypothetical protein Glove_103g212 [Diversispora epigaea]